MVDHEYNGKCLCGAVSYRATGLADIWYCHCTQCRSLTGHFLAACRTRRDRLFVSGDIVWSPHSGAAEHARCAQCGSLLFWANRSTNSISVLPGGLENTDGIDVGGHIFVSEKGGYYEIDDGLPQFGRYPAEASGN
ncbi:MAG: GFA family protein [Sphingomonadaceae bacterium]